MKYLDGFRDPAAAAVVSRQIGVLAAKLRLQRNRICIMEVCGTHTMAIARTGIREILPEGVDLVSGPGCPVCVTDAAFIDAAVELTRRGIIVATFGDMLRVPGSEVSLEICRAEGGDVRVCYSPLEVLTWAVENPKREVVFLAIGFETTIGPALGLLVEAERCGLKNVSLLTAFKTVPQALVTLSKSQRVCIDGFLLPAHVSAVIGSEAYQFLPEQFGKVGVVAGFEALDILWALKEILVQVSENRAAIVNQYDRVVQPRGNPRILQLFSRYLEPSAACWRGLGTLPESGLSLRPEYLCWDAATRFGVPTTGGKDHPGCKCGQVLEGALRPPDCPLYGKVCTPREPVGPCMVSSEGTCAAYFKYARRAA